MANDKDRIAMCLNIIRFSHATAPRSSTFAAWTHLTAADIHLFIDGPQSLSPMHLKVLHGNRCIEDVELGSLIDAAMDKRRAASEAKLMLSFNDQPVYAVASDTRLALRYHLPDGQQRRIQFSMKSSSDTEQVVALFGRRGMVFQEQRPGNATVQVQNAKLAANPSQSAAHSVTSLAKSQSQSCEPNQPESQPPADDAGSFSSRTFAFNSNKSASTATMQLVPASQGTTTQMFPPFLPQRERQSSTILAGPETSQICPSNTAMQPMMQERVQEQTAQTSASHTDAALRDSTFPAPTSWQPPSTTESSHATEVVQQRGLMSSSPRLATPSSSLLSFPGTLEHEIPPRRELPFAKRPSSSRQSGSDRSGSRPSTATVSPTKQSRLPTTRTPIPSSPPNRSSEVAAENIRPKTASAPKRTAVAAFGAARPSTAVTPKSAIEDLKPMPAPALATPSGEKIPATAKSKPVGRPPTRMDELLYGRRAITEQPARLSIHTNAMQPLDQPASAKMLTPAATSDEPSIRFNAAIPKTSDLNSNNWAGLESFAAQSAEDRHAALDEFMVRCLEDPGFTRLCEDVENCWRRIALGL